jgi:chromosome partitioning protein
MRVFVFAATKGGVGKSTLAACTAIAAQAEGETVVLVDYDPQRSLSEWLALRSGAKPELLVVPRGASLKAALKDVAADAVVIVDTPPGMVGIIEQAVMGADLVVIPIRPAPLDILAIDPIVELVEECKKPSVLRKAFECLSSSLALSTRLIKPVVTSFAADSIISIIFVNAS